MFTLPELPYPKDALQPYMSAETFEYHHGKHHMAYVQAANDLIEGSAYEGLAVEEVIRRSFGKDPKIFNNVAQHYNHSEFWKAMKPKGGGSLPGRLERQIKTDFGSLDAFRERFVAEGLARFGSGWIWLVWNGERLTFTSTPNAENPLVEGMSHILVADVWEHAYYIDYRNRRADFLKAFIHDLVNWDYALERFDAVTA